VANSNSHVVQQHVNPLGIVIMTWGSKRRGGGDTGAVIGKNFREKGQEGEGAKSEPQEKEKSQGQCKPSKGKDFMDRRTRRTRGGQTSLQGKIENQVTTSGKKRDSKQKRRVSQHQGPKRGREEEGAREDEVLTLRWGRGKNSGRIEIPESGLNQYMGRRGVTPDRFLGSSTNPKKVDPIYHQEEPWCLGKRVDREKSFLYRRERRKSRRISTA